VLSFLNDLFGSDLHLIPPTFTTWLTVNLTPESLRSGQVQGSKSFEKPRLN
jgi:hypothetical protein